MAQFGPHRRAAGAVASGSLVLACVAVLVCGWSGAAAYESDNLRMGWGRR